MTAYARIDARSASVQDASAPYEVGYGKPPRHTQFRKGRSGNPGGRPRGLPVERAKAMLLEEAYRLVPIKENGRMVPGTVLQAILRSQMELAMNGNYRAQRDVLEAVRDLEAMKSIGVYKERYEEDDSDEDEIDEACDASENCEAERSGDACETGEDDEAEESIDANEAGSGDATAVTAAPGATDLPPPRESSSAPLVSSAAPDRPAAPEARPPDGSAVPGPAAPSWRRRRTPDGARGGRQRAVKETRATGGGTAACQRGGVPRGNAGPAKSGKIPC